MVLRVASALGNKVFALLNCKRLEPVAVTGELVGWRRHIVDVLTDFLVLDAQVEHFTQGMDREFLANALGSEHVTQ